MLATALLIAGVAGDAAAAERRVSGLELREIARKEMLWCETYHPETDDCDVITLVRLLPDGRLSETSTLLIQEEPRLQVYIGDYNAIQGDRLCSKIETSKTSFAFMLEGRPIEPTAAAGLQMLFMAQLAEFDGKTMCQTFFKDDAQPDVVREEITVDGERREDLESTYILREGDSGLNLRPQVTDEEDARVQI